MSGIGWKNRGERTIDKGAYMSKTEEQHPFVSPMAVLNFIEEMAKQSFTTVSLKNLVASAQWLALYAIGELQEGEIRIDQAAAVTSGKVVFRERLVIAAGDDFQLAWVVESSSKEWLRFQVVSVEKGGLFWRSQCAACLSWDFTAAPNFLMAVGWIQLNRSQEQQQAQERARGLAEAQAFSFRLYDAQYGVKKGGGL